MPKNIVGTKFFEPILCLNFLKHHRHNCFKTVHIVQVLFRKTIPVNCLKNLVSPLRQGLALAATKKQNKYFKGMLKNCVVSVKQIIHIQSVLWLLARVCSYAAQGELNGNLALNYLELHFYILMGPIGHIQSVF